MIRRWIVSVIAMLAALAAGIALGGGPLSDVGDTPSDAAPPPVKVTKDPRVDARASLEQGFPGGVATGLYAGRLSGHRVAVLTLPGADGAQVEALGGEVGSAGGELVGTYALRRPLVDVGEKTLVDTFGVQVVEQLGSDVVTADATTYDRIGQLVGRAVAAKNEKRALPSGKVASLRASLEGAGMLGLPEGDPPLADLVLVVAGRAVEPLVLKGLVAGLAVAARVVVAGPTLDPGVSALRAEPPTRPVTTVDGTETPAGRVVTALALVHATAAAGGAYGASGADGPVPLG